MKKNRARELWIMRIMIFSLVDTDRMCDDPNVTMRAPAGKSKSMSKRFFIHSFFFIRNLYPSFKYLWDILGKFHAFLTYFKVIWPVLA